MKRNSLQKLIFLYVLIISYKTIRSNEDKISVTYSTSDNKYTLTISGNTITDSGKKCGIQFYDKTENNPTNAVKSLLNCRTVITGASEDSATKMCIYSCGSKTLKYSDNEFKKIKYIKINYGDDDTKVKERKTSKVFTIRDVYIKTDYTATKSGLNIQTNIKSKVNGGYDLKLGSTSLSSVQTSNDFYTQKTITLETKDYGGIHSIEPKNKSPKIFINPTPTEKDFFIATGSKSSVNGKSLYTVTLQNPMPSKLCYFGIKAHTESSFISKCSFDTTASDCLQPCFKATLIHDNILYFARVVIKAYDKNIGGSDFVQTITFGQNQPTVGSIQQQQVTIDLSSFNKNERSTSTVGSASVTELKLIRKNLGTTSAGTDATCNNGCTSFASKTVTGLSTSTEYILKVKISGLNTKDSSSDGFYHRYFYFKTKGTTFQSSKSFTLTPVANINTKITVSMTNLIASGQSSGRICRLYYAESSSESYLLPATCEISSSNQFCSQQCTQSFTVVNLNPKTNYKFTVCSPGYDCEASNQASTNGATISVAVSEETAQSLFKAAITVNSGSANQKWSYILYEKFNKNILKDCSNANCDPNISGNSVSFPFSTCNIDTEYGLLIWNDGTTSPATTDIKSNTIQGNENIYKYNKAQSIVNIKFRGDLINQPGECTIKVSNKDYSNYVDMCGTSTAVSSCTQSCYSLRTGFDFTYSPEKKLNYISVTYTITEQREKSASSSNAKIDENVAISKGKVYNILIDHIQKLAFTAAHEEDNIKFSYNSCTMECKAHKDSLLLSTIVKQETGTPCSSSSYSIPFDEKFNIYWIKCSTYIDYYYYYDNAYVHQKAPAQNRFYYHLTIDEAKSELTVKLVNEKPGEICTFEWIDATSTLAQAQAFSNSCGNNNKCFYNPCTQIKFSNVGSDVKAVKVKVVKLGMDLPDAYRDNAYILKQGNDVEVTTSNDKIKIDISSNNKADDGTAPTNPAPTCTLKIWNVNAPLTNEDQRKDVTSPSCTFSALEIVPSDGTLRYDIQVSLTGITSYNGIKKYFAYKKTQTENLSIQDNAVAPKATGFTLTPDSNSELKCQIFVKESAYGNYFPAVCNGEKMCLDACKTEFTIIGLFSNVNYDIRIIPTGNKAIKDINTKKTDGQSLDFKWSGSTTRSNLVIKLTSVFNDATTTNCYYHLVKYADDKLQHTEYKSSCVGCSGANVKKCNSIEFPGALYENKNEYRIIVYAADKSNPVKIDIPKIYQKGAIQQKLAAHTDGDIDKFTVTLSDFPENSYKCLIKITNFESTPAFIKPTCSGNTDGTECIADCNAADVEIARIVSKQPRYLSVCWGYDKTDAGLCKEAAIFQLKMDYLQKHTYKVAYESDKPKITFKSNSVTDWKIYANENEDTDGGIDLTNFKITSYVDEPTDKSVLLTLGRKMDYYLLKSSSIWPSIIYYTNNTYLKKNTPMQSKMFYSIESNANTDELLINHIPGLDYDEICHVKVNNVQDDGSDGDSILNSCKKISDGCYQLCRHTKIALQAPLNEGTVGIQVKRRLDGTNTFKQYFRKGESGVALSDITDNGVKLVGLNTFTTNKKGDNNPTCTITITKAHLFSQNAPSRAQCNNANCDTNCAESYDISGFEAATNYIIAITVTEMGTTSTYVKYLGFRTSGGTAPSVSATQPTINYVTYVITPMQQDKTLAICRLYIKKTADGSPDFGTPVCKNIGVCEDLCHSEFTVINLDVGEDYKIIVESSLGKQVIEKTFKTKEATLTFSSITNGYSDLTIQTNNDAGEVDVICEFTLYEEISNTMTIPKYWCYEDECSNKCVIDFNGLSRRYNYKLRVRVINFSKMNEHEVQYLKPELGYIEGNYRTRLDDLNKIDPIEEILEAVHPEKLDSGANINNENTKLLHSYILYGMIPIIVALLGVVGLGIFKVTAGKSMDL